MAHRSGRRDSGPVDELLEIEVFGVGPTGELVSSAHDDLPTSADVGRRLWRLAAEGVDHAMHLQAATGPRPGVSADRPERLGAREDVIAAVLVDPMLSAAAVLDGDLFADPLPGLVVDQDTLAVDIRGIAWAVAVRTSLVARPRRATLRLYPSASSNLTVIELIPNRPRVFWTWAFVRAGIAGVEALGQRLMRHASRHDLEVVQGRVR